MHCENVENFVLLDTFTVIVVMEVVVVGFVWRRIITPDLCCLGSFGPEIKDQVDKTINDTLK